ncbi:MAG: hypothetical protein Q8P95_01390 [bacterium]|nr:hypothetical protein [bacterium]
MSFLAQLNALVKSQPMIALPVDSSCENCEYNTYLYKSRNCYLCVASSRLENCLYLESSDRCKDSAEGYGNAECELTYECLDCKKCYNCDWCQDCLNCSDLQFSFDCIGCRNCFGCVGLRQKQYHLFNKPLSKEEYEASIAQFDSGNPQHIAQFRKKFEELKLKVPRPHTRGISNENVTGDFINNSKNIIDSYYVDKSEDIIYGHDEIYGDKDCVDVDHLHNSELCYNVMSCDQSFNCNHCWFLIGCNDLEYCFAALNSKNCFGCVNIKNKQYCILNQQFTKEEYEMKVAEIKQAMIEAGEYGRYFDSTFSHEDRITSDIFLTR